MLRDLLDALRCPTPHEESWLVAVVTRADGRLLWEADLACPVCASEFTVRSGVASFGGVPQPSSGAVPDAERLAALLGVLDGERPVLLTGAYARAGTALAALTTAPQLWLDAPTDALTEASTDAGARRSPLVGCSRLPLGVDTLAAAAVDAAHATPDMLASIVRALGQGARLVAPVTTPLPPGVRELARDAAEWVAETTTRASGLIELRRRASSD
jgi:hypothetical protein